MLCSFLDADLVILSDSEPMVPFIQMNINENELEKRVTATEHTWGSFIVQEEFSSLEQSQVQKEFENPRKETFDFLIGSDIIHDPALYEDLWQSLENFSLPGTKVVLSFSERNPMEWSFFDYRRCVTADGIGDGLHCHCPNGFSDPALRDNSRWRMTDRSTVPRSSIGQPQSQAGGGAEKKEQYCVKIVELIRI